MVDCTLAELSCDLQVERFGPSWTELVAERVGVLAEADGPKLLGVCCHVLCCTVFDCAVFSDKLPRGVEFEFGRGMLGAGVGAAEGVACTGVSP